MRDNNSGGSSNYYITPVMGRHMMVPDRIVYSEGIVYEAECGDIINALELNPTEANIFKSIWRKAMARKGVEKINNSALRDAQKIKFFADHLLRFEEAVMDDMIKQPFKGKISE